MVGEKQWVSYWKCHLDVDMKNLPTGDLDNPVYLDSPVYCNISELYF